MKKISIKNLKELKAFAVKFATTLKGGDVVGLVGDLGAGKTTFTQYLAKALGVKKDVKSPTFIIMQILETGTAAKKNGINHLCHIDAYRIEDEEELRLRGIEEYLQKKDTVALIEWADRVPSLHRVPGYKEITFTFGKGEERILRVQ